eukprot:m.123597 g.123597  ORF g.123597 m.123597 type:complete len:70 (-) comp13467_c0_seq3:76-285(-)
MWQKNSTVFESGVRLLQPNPLKIREKVPCAPRGLAGSTPGGSLSGGIDFAGFGTTHLIFAGFFAGFFQI